MALLESYISQLDKIFKNQSRHASHKIAAPLVLEMCKNKAILYEIIRNNLVDDKLFTNQQHGPVIGFDIVIQRDYTFSAHAFFPVPNRADNISHNWIHHHDHSLLTTGNAFGEKGYKSMLFNMDYHLDPTTKKVTNLKVTKEFSHPLHNIEFIDAFEPHVVYLPSALTITYALWSFDYLPKLDLLRSNPLIKLFKSPLKKIINIFKIEKALAVETETDDRQFATENGEFVCVGNLQYIPTSNATYLQNLFYLLQQVKFDDAIFLSELKKRAAAKGRNDVVELIDKLMNGIPINDEMDYNQFNSKGMNFTYESVLEASKKISTI